MNISKEKDGDGHWYWIPADMLDEFSAELEEITGIDYMDNPDAFDRFNDKYEKYRTNGDPDNVPDIFKNLESHPPPPAGTGAGPIHISGTESVVYARGANGRLSYFRIFKDSEDAVLQYTTLRNALVDVVIMDIGHLDNLLR